MALSEFFSWPDTFVLGSLTTFLYSSDKCVCLLQQSTHLWQGGGQDWGEAALVCVCGHCFVDSTKCIRGFGGLRLCWRILRFFIFPPTLCDTPIQVHDTTVTMLRGSSGHCSHICPSNYSQGFFFVRVSATNFNQALSCGFWSFVRGMGASQFMVVWLSLDCNQCPSSFQFTADLHLHGSWFVPDHLNQFPFGSEWHFGPSLRRSGSFRHFLFGSYGFMLWQNCCNLRWRVKQFMLCVWFVLCKILPWHSGPWWRVFVIAKTSALLFQYFSFVCMVIVWWSGLHVRYFLQVSDQLISHIRSVVLGRIRTEAVTLRMY